MQKPDKAREMESLRAEILAQNVCANLKKTAKNLVLGAGNLDAEIIFIGEAPGKNEDEKGLPFVGAAGKFLDEMLARANLNREKVYITNIVKYRPPENRDPTPEEKAEFLPFLLRQIEIIQPKILATLGRHSMNEFLPNAKISAIHGRAQNIDFEGKNLTILPLFHPAAALYNGAMRATLLADFAKLPEILAKIEHFEMRENVLKIMNS